MGQSVATASSAITFSLTHRTALRYPPTPPATAPPQNEPNQPAGDTKDIALHTSCAAQEPTSLMDLPPPQSVGVKHLMVGKSLGSQSGMEKSLGEDACHSSEVVLQLCTGSAHSGNPLGGGREVASTQMGTVVDKWQWQCVHSTSTSLLHYSQALSQSSSTFSTVPTHQLLGSANAETTPARAPAAAADRKQRPDATCEGKNG